MKVGKIYSSLFAISLLFTGAPQSFASEFEDVSEIYNSVTVFLENHYYENNGDAQSVTINVSRLDSRLRLQRCDKSLTFTLRDTGNHGGNVAVRTRCEGSKPWAILVSAKVVMKLPVIVAKHNLAKGTRLTEADLEIIDVDTTTLAYGFVTNLADTLGKELTRPTVRGQPIRQASLSAPKVIKRGDAVVIEAHSRGISVSSQGIALSDGKVGQQIRIKNEQSQRTVMVEVLAEGRVQAIL